jgi:hypothetical protein
VEFIKITFGKKVKTTIVLDKDRSLIGVCNWVRSPKLLGTQTVVTGAYGGLGGMLIQPDLQDILVNEMISIAKESKSALLIRTQVDAPSLKDLVSDELVYFEKHIGDEDLMNELDKKLRYEVKRSIRLEVSNLEGYELSETSEISSFLAKCFQTLGTPFPGSRYLKNLQRVFQNDLIFIQLREQNSNLVGLAILIKLSDSIHVLHANVSERGKDLSAGYRLYYEIFVSSQAQGITRINFGRSMKGSSQASFKRKWCMKENNVTFLRTGDAAFPFQYDKRLKQSALFIWSWKRLPFWLVKVTGPKLSKLII